MFKMAFLLQRISENKWPRGWGSCPYLSRLRVSSAILCNNNSKPQAHREVFEFYVKNVKPGLLTRHNATYITDTPQMFDQFPKTGVYPSRRPSDIKFTGMPRMNEWLTHSASGHVYCRCSGINKERACRKKLEAIWHTWFCENNAAPEWNSVRLETKESITDYISCSGMDSTNKMEGSMPKCRTT